MPIQRLAPNQVPDSSGADFFSGGNIYFRPDPLQQEIEQAKLAELRQHPYLEQARLRLEQEDRARMLEALRTQSSQEQARLAEESAFHRESLAETRRGREDTLGLERGRLAEESRYHAGELGLGEKKLTTETEQAERDRKTKLADALGYHALQLESAGLSPKGSTALFLKKLGYPELEAAEGEASERGLTAEAATLTGLDPKSRAELLKKRPELAKYLGTTAAPAATAAPAPSESIATKIGRFAGSQIKPLGQLQQEHQRYEQEQKEKANRFWSELLTAYRGSQSTPTPTLAGGQ